MFDVDKGGAFRGFHHIGYVTNDLAQAVEVMRQQYGLAKISDCGEHPVTLADGSQYLHKTAMIFVEPWGVELIQPTGGNDSIYREFLPSRGFGMNLHHVCFSAPSRAELDAAKDGFVAAGYRIAVDSQKTNFFYADTREFFGHYTEWAYVGPFETEFLRDITRYPA